MAKVVSFGRDLPCLKPKRRPKNIYQLELRKNWIGEFAVTALDAARTPVIEIAFIDAHHLRVWCATHFRERLFPSDIAAMVECAEKGDAAEFPIRATREALLRYGMKEPSRI